VRTRALAPSTRPAVALSLAPPSLRCSRPPCVAAQGSSTLKLKSAAGKDVAGGRKELERLLDHFNVDVNNPINVMTQDSSRQFLQSGSAKARRLS